MVLSVQTISCRSVWNEFDGKDTSSTQQSWGWEKIWISQEVLKGDKLVCCWGYFDFHIRSNFLHRRSRQFGFCKFFLSFLKINCFKCNFLDFWFLAWWFRWRNELSNCWLDSLLHRYGFDHPGDLCLRGEVFLSPTLSETLKTRKNPRSSPQGQESQCPQRKTCP